MYLDICCCKDRDTRIDGSQKDVYDYNESLQSVLAMEIYHGEPTIEALVKNTQQVSESFDELGSVITNLLSGD